MSFGQLVIGPPGSGKTTYCNGMQHYFQLIRRPCAVVNLDPANHAPPYQVGRGGCLYKLHRESRERCVSAPSGDGGRRTQRAPPRVCVVLGGRRGLAELRGVRGCSTGGREGRRGTRTARNDDEREFSHIFIHPAGPVRRLPAADPSLSTRLRYHRRRRRLLHPRGTHRRRFPSHAA
jgi:hypothetical protein